MFAFRAASRTCVIWGTHLFASATPFKRSHTFPPSDMKSLYGSMRRSAVISLSNFRFAIVLSPYAFTRIESQICCMRASADTCGFECEYLANVVIGGTSLSSASDARQDEWGLAGGASATADSEVR